MSANAERPLEQSRSSAPPSSKGEGKSSCVACRRLKMKCIRIDDDAPCERCSKARRECEAPPFRKAGRTLGAKNKYTAVERAVRKIQAELKRGGGDPSTLDGGALSASIPPDFLAALQSADALSKSLPIASTSDTHRLQPVASTSAIPIPDRGALDRTFDSLPSSSFSSPRPSTTTVREQGEEITNPLGLLAEASCALPSSSSLRIDQTMLEMLSEGAEVDPRIARLGLSTSDLSASLLAITSSSETRTLGIGDFDFFRTPLVSTHRDIGPSLDPLDLALLTEEEAYGFFETFFANMHPLVSVLDPAIHTPNFCRSRSAFLFTTICSNGAIFESSAAAVSTRLQNHLESLTKRIVSERYRSTEIVQGYLLYLPWLGHAQRLSDDQIWQHSNHAIAIAGELGLERPLSVSLPPDKLHAQLQADLDGLDLSQPDLVSRMVRNRERLWLRFFLFESALAVAFGRGSLFVQNERIKNDEWHLHPLSGEFDKETSTLVRLRRYFISLSNDVKYRLQDPNLGTEWIQPHVDEVLDGWRRQFFSGSAPEQAHRVSSQYVEVIYRHGRLWILSHGLHVRPGAASTGVPKIVSDCLSAALEACQIAVMQFGEHGYSSIYWFLPNTVAPLLSWAAILAIRLFDSDPALPSFFPSQASLLAFLGKLGLLLEEAGTTPPHRLGTTAVYGRHLQVIVRSRLVALFNLYQESLLPNSSIATASCALPLSTPALQVEPAVAQPFASWGADWWMEDLSVSSWSDEVSNLTGIMWPESRVGEMGLLR